MFHFLCVGGTAHEIWVLVILKYNFLVKVISFQIFFVIKMQNGEIIFIGPSDKQRVCGDPAVWRAPNLSSGGRCSGGADR